MVRSCEMWIKLARAQLVLTHLSYSPWCRVSELKFCSSDGTLSNTVATWPDTQMDVEITQDKHQFCVPAKMFPEVLNPLWTCETNKCSFRCEWGRELPPGIAGAKSLSTSESFSSLYKKRHVPAVSEKPSELEGTQEMTFIQKPPASQWLRSCAWAAFFVITTALCDYKMEWSLDGTLTDTICLSVCPGKTWHGSRAFKFAWTKRYFF